MKKMVFLLITFLVQLVFPGELVLDLKKENVNKLEKKATVLYGEKTQKSVFLLLKNQMKQVTAFLHFLLIKMLYMLLTALMESLKVQKFLILSSAQKSISNRSTTIFL